jgi:type VI secretion system ImpM family protein
MGWRSLLSVIGRSPAPLPADDRSLPALFGKLPGRADFVRLGAPGRPELERWLEEGLELVRGKGGGLPGATGRFLLAGPPGGRRIVGLMVPSGDAVGRSFPVCLFRPLSAGGGSGLVAGWRQQVPFLEAAGQLLGRRPPPTVDALTAALASWDDSRPAPPEPASTDGPATGGPATGGHPTSASALDLEMQSVADLAAQALAELAVPGLPEPPPDVQAPAAGADGASADPVEVVLASCAARTALEPVFGPMEQGLAAQAACTFLSACEAARGAARALTIECPAPDERLELFWLALASRKLGWMTCGPSVLALPGRLVMELADAAASPGLLAAACLGLKAGPRHWVVRDAGSPAPAGEQPTLPPPARAVLESRDASLQDVLRALS